MRKKTYKSADLRLNTLNGINPAIIKSITGLASQIGTLSATDVEQLRDLAALEIRIARTQEMVDRAAEEDDLALWHKISLLVDRQVGQKRMILRDLKITRSSLPSPSAGVRDAKAKGKSGTEWEGVL